MRDLLFVDDDDDDALAYHTEQAIQGTIFSYANDSKLCGHGVTLRKMKILNSPAPRNLCVFPLTTIGNIVRKPY